jgi:hypothetical protein
VCPGDTVALTASQADGVWGNINVTLAHVAPASSGGGIAVGLLPGSDTVTYTISRMGCSSTAKYPITVRSEKDCAGQITEIKGKGCTGEGVINVYPNPSTDGQVTINLSSNYNEAANVIVFDMAGRTVFKGLVNTNSPVNLNIGLPRADYMTLAITPHGRCMEKLTVTK